MTMKGAFFQIWIAPERKLFDFPEFMRMCCLPKGFESQLNLDSQSNSSFGISSKAPRLRNRFYTFRLKGFYKLGCFLNSRLKFLKSFLANETMI